MNRQRLLATHFIRTYRFIDKGQSKRLTAKTKRTLFAMSESKIDTHMTESMASADDKRTKSLSAIIAAAGTKPRGGFLLQKITVYDNNFAFRADGCPATAEYRIVKPHCFRFGKDGRRHASHALHHRRFPVERDRFPCFPQMARLPSPLIFIPVIGWLAFGSRASHGKSLCLFPFPHALMGRAAAIAKGKSMRERKSRKHSKNVVLHRKQL